MSFPVLHILTSMNVIMMMMMMISWGRGFVNNSLLALSRVCICGGALLLLSASSPPARVSWGFVVGFEIQMVSEACDRTTSDYSLRSVSFYLAHVCSFLWRDSTLSSLTLRHIFRNPLPSLASASRAFILISLVNASVNYTNHNKVMLDVRYHSTNVRWCDGV